MLCLWLLRKPRGLHDRRVVDKSWDNGLFPYEVPFEGDLELLAERELAKNVREDVEGRKESRDDDVSGVGLIIWPDSLAVSVRQGTDCNTICSLASRTFQEGEGERNL